jgi:hypothetical protein
VQDQLPRIRARKSQSRKMWRIVLQELYKVYVVHLVYRRKTKVSKCEGGEMAPTKSVGGGEIAGGLPNRRAVEIARTHERHHYLKSMRKRSKILFLQMEELILHLCVTLRTRRTPSLLKPLGFALTRHRLRPLWSFLQMRKRSLMGRPSARWKLIEHYELFFCMVWRIWEASHLVRRFSVRLAGPVLRRRPYILSITIE